jgi:hypothetical protein
MLKYLLVGTNSITEVSMIEMLVYGDGLKGLKFFYGGEGNAYFIGDQLILKEYDDNFAIRGNLDEIFPLYCEQVNLLRANGISLPEFYEYRKLKNKDGNYKFYILQERIKGRELFFFDPVTFCKNFYYKNLSFQNSNDMGGADIQRDIILKYIDDYIMINSYIEAMDEKTIEKFIVDAFNIYAYSEYALPDIGARNVILNLDDKKLSHIDLCCVDRKREEEYSGLSENNFYYDNILSDLVRLFKFNNFAALKNMSSFKTLVDSNESFDALVKKMMLENSVICDAALRKILTVMNSCFLKL